MKTFKAPLPSLYKRSAFKLQLLAILCVSVAMFGCNQQNATQNTNTPPNANANANANAHQNNTATQQTEAADLNPATASSEPAETAPTTATSTTSTHTEPENSQPASDSNTLPLLKLLPDSQLTFTAEQIGVPVEGRFKTFDAQVRLDPTAQDIGSLEKASIRFVVDTSSASVGMADTDAELQGAAWFGGVAQQQAIFTSSLITQASPDSYEITGTLSIKNKNQPVTTTVKVAPAGDKQWLVTGGFPIERLAFDIGTSPWDDTSIVKNTVDVVFQLRFTQ